MRSQESMAARAFLALPVLSSLLLSLCVLTSAENLFFKTVSVNALFPSMDSAIPTAPVTARREGEFVTLRRIGETPLSKEALARDSLRVASIQKKLPGRPIHRTPIVDSTHHNISVRPKTGFNLGATNFAFLIAIGTPLQLQPVIMDTSTDICWVQCKSCGKECFPQRMPSFDPALSSTYHNISCDSPTCKGIHSRRCMEGNCRYVADYGDGSFSFGSLASDTLRMPWGADFDNILFGCGDSNDAHLNGSAGVVGLARTAYSLNAQLKFSHGNVFSYCLPSHNTATTAYLQLGGSRKTPVGYTPMVTDPRAPSLYFLNLTGITVGGKNTASLSAFSAGTIIDVGTEITRLPATAYTALKTAFRAALKDYPAAAAFGVMDTCYDLSQNYTVKYPLIRFQYDGIEVTLPEYGVFYTVSNWQICLAFAGNDDDRQITIIGYVQHRTMEVTYDNVRNRIGFSDEGAC